MSGLRRCGVCSAGMGPAMEECLRCGAPASMAAPPPAAAPAPALATLPPPPADAVPLPDFDACDACGARLTEGVDWCGRCFTPVRATSAVSSGSGAASASSAPLYSGAAHGVGVPVFSGSAFDGPAVGIRDAWSPPPPPQLAHWIERVGALLLDYGMLFAGMLAIGVPFGRAGAFPMALFGGVFAFWNFVIRQGRTGQTLGKKILRISLVHEAGRRPIGSWSCFWRSFLHSVDSIPLYLGWLWPLWDGKRQTFADKIQGTIVIKVGRGQR